MGALIAVKISIAGPLLITFSLNTYEVILGKYSQITEWNKLMNIFPYFSLNSFRYNKEKKLKIIFKDFNVPCISIIATLINLTFFKS